MEDVPDELIGVILVGKREIIIRARVYTDIDGVVHVFADRTRRDLMTDTEEEFETLDLEQSAKLEPGDTLSISLDIDVD